MKQKILDSGLVMKNGFIDLPEKVDCIKIDVGLSGNAPHSEIWTERNDALCVIGFEPISKNRKMIETCSSPWPVKLNPIKLRQSVFVIPVALANFAVPKYMKMYITDEDPGCSSLLIPTQLKSTDHENVSVYKLADFLIFFPFKRFKNIDHLKIDAQGMDFEILKGCSRYLKHFSYVTAEVDKNYKLSKNNHFRLKIYMFGKGFIRVRNLSSIILKVLYNHEIIVSDPTFFNIRLLYQNRKNLFIFQEG